MRKTICKLLCVLSFACFAAPRGASAAEVMEIPPRKTAAFFQSKKSLSPGDAFLPCHVGGLYLGFSSFDTKELKIENTNQLELSVGIQYLAASAQGTEPTMLELLPMCRPLADYTLPRTDFSVRDAFDPNAAAIASAELPVSSAKGDLVTVKLPCTEATLQALSRGIVLRLRGRGKVKIVQVNFYSAKSAPDKIALRLKLKAVLKDNNLGKLSLVPLVRPRKGVYVTTRDGNFYYGGKQIRFSGVNFNDSSLSYEAIDKCVDRLANMNINGIRLWAGGYPFYTPQSARKGEMAPSKKGDNSILDRYDYLVAKCQEKGIFIHNTSLGSHTPPLEYWPDLPLRITREEGKHYDHNFYTAAPALPYLHKAYRDMRIRHIEQYLNRVNPYTMERYADMPVFASWELANENHTVTLLLDGRFRKWHKVFLDTVTVRWNEFLIRKYASEEKLLAAWGRLEPGESLHKRTVAPAPIYSEAAKYPPARGRDYVQFAEEVFRETSKVFERAARAQSAPGVGINGAPIVHNTHADLNLHAHYASSGGDTLSCGVYQTPYTTDKTKAFYPWKP
ncbi:MAG: hypothetical protein PHS41_04960, partial [Victivallaceae bacterium]|nr:hypothetical protein [Victivallaceae bacterium]